MCVNKLRNLYIESCVWLHNADWLRAQEIVGPIPLDHCLVRTNRNEFMAFETSIRRINWRKVAYLGSLHVLALHYLAPLLYIIFVRYIHVVLNISLNECMYSPRTNRKQMAPSVQCQMARHLGRCVSSLIN